MPRELGRPPTRAELNRALVVNAATKPVNVVVPAAIIVVAVVLGLWWLIPVVAVPAFIALVVVTYLDGDEAEKVGRRLRGERTGGKVAPRRLDASRMAPPIAHHVRAALDEERRIRAAIEESDLPFTEVGGEVESLVSAVEKTARRAQSLWEYLSTKDPAQIRNRIAQLEASGDPNARQVSEALRQQVDALEQLNAQLQRFFAQMEHMTASLGTMHAQLLRMSAVSEAEGDRQLAGQARALREEMTAVAQGMAEVYEQAESTPGAPSPRGPGPSATSG